MNSDNGKHRIVCAGYGSYTVYDCTVDNARALLDENLGNLYQECKDLAEKLHSGAKTVYIVVDEAVTNALVEIVKKPVGTETRALRRLVHGPAPTASSGKPDERPHVLVDEELRKEVALWAFNNELNVQSLDSIGPKLNALKPHESLSFLANLVKRAAGRPIQYVASDVHGTATDLNQLLYGKWKATVDESRIVQNYLSFINDHLTHRDVKYELATYCAKA